MADDLIKFPDNFLWGAATSAYQIEGAYDEGGRGESIWDRFCQKPGKVFGGHHGKVACDHYHRCKNDFKMLAELGVRHYRFSVAWPRIFPKGRGQVNRKGVDFYNRLVDTLLAHKIEPCLTLNHWDLPQALENLGGWPNHDLVKYFQDYAGEVSRRLGDRVRRWVTHNEPAIVAFLGYYEGIFAPAITDLTQALKAAHHLLVSHGLAVQAIRENLKQPGEVGIVLHLIPAYPYSDSLEDADAARRYFDRYFSWFLEPLYHARYPEELIDRYRTLKIFPDVDVDELKKAAVPTDFLGVNYYFRALVQHAAGNNEWDFREITPQNVAKTAMGWEIFPEGLYDLLRQIHRTYKPPKIYITENGAAFNDEVSEDGEVHDADRIDYIHRHLYQSWRAIQDGVPLAGYYVWSLMDNFEWASGYSKRFGIVHVDYETQQRIPKDSAKWYREVIERNGIREME